MCACFLQWGGLGWGVSEEGVCQEPLPDAVDTGPLSLLSA